MGSTMTNAFPGWELRETPGGTILSAACGPRWLAVVITLGCAAVPLATLVFGALPPVVFAFTVALPAWYLLYAHFINRRVVTLAGENVAFRLRPLPWFGSFIMARREVSHVALLVDQGTPGPLTTGIALVRSDRQVFKILLPAHNRGDHVAFATDLAQRLTVPFLVAH